MAADEVILEYQRVGAVVKVSAIDPETLVEVTIQGPASWGEAALRRTALSKLRYVLARRGLAAPDSTGHAVTARNDDGRPADRPPPSASAAAKRTSRDA